MYTYNSVDYNETGAFYRLVNAMRKAKENGRGFSVFIGAGCSLSSSPFEISTVKIIENCIKDNFDERYRSPDSWEALYRDFVNYIWEPHGDMERREILSEYLLKLTPAKGYGYLRSLVEYGYITDIVTTNFDMLINSALEGLSYQLQVGDQQTRVIKGGSNICVYKIHGDIESGQLRFSPHELKELPEKISERIKGVSVNSSFFCGYSGQDQGLMKSLVNKSDYAVYWVSPMKPVKENVYDNRLIYEWMTARNSESNFICGDALGKFDGLMEQLFNALIENRIMTDNASLWNKSTISDAIRINERVYSIFKQLLQCSSSLRGEYKWRREYPFYSKDYETTLNAYLFYYCESTYLPSGLLQMPENEIEALVMGLAIEILASASGIRVSPSDFAAKLKLNYESTSPQYLPDTSFWQALMMVLASIENNKPLKENDNLLDIKLKMNNNGRMTLSVKEPKLSHVVNTLSLLSISGLFIPTCERNSSIDGIGESKILLQKHGQVMHATDGKLCFKLEGISRRELSDIFHAFFNNLSGYHLDEKGTIYGPNVIIKAEIVEKASITNSTSLTDFLFHLAFDTTTKFKKLKSAFEIDSDHYVKGPISDALDEFMQSDKTGMFIIGSSGAGKTKEIQHFIRTYSAYDDYMIAVASPKISSFDNLLGLSVFWSELLDHCDESVFFEEVGAVLAAREIRLVLIIDGLNEIDGGANACSNHYRSIIQTIDRLDALPGKPVKVMITCRDHAFLDYCEQTALYPTVETCYCTFDTQNIMPYYKICPLTLEQQLQFADLYFDDSHQKNIFEIDIQNNPHIQQMFSQPYMIAIAGKNYGLPRKGSISILQDIFKHFAEQMLKRLGSISTRAVAIKMIDAYFDLMIRVERFGRRITPFVLLNQLSPGIDSENASAVLKQLCDINLFTSLHNEEYIRFTHDRIEEYFVCEYLYARASRKDVLACVSGIAKSDLIFHSAVINYFRKLAQQGFFEQLVENCETLYSNEQLPYMLAGCMEILNENNYIQLFSAVHKRCFDSDSFIILILNSLKQAIVRDDIGYPEQLIKYYENLSAIFPALIRYGKYFYYIASRFYLIQRGDIALAAQYCDIALQHEGEDEHLTQLVVFQNAVIQKNKGQLDDAIEKLSAIFIYFRDNRYWDSAAECVLEWGSALRQKAEFKDALKVYKMIDTEHIAKLPELQMKLHRRRGNIHKNIMYRQLSCYDACEDMQLRADIYQSYSDAQREFETAIKISVHAMDTIEKMMIMEEQAVTALKYSGIEPSQMMRARFLLADVEKMLALFPVPDIQIVHMRHISNLKELNAELQDAIAVLEQAQIYAKNHANAFRIFEVDYQLGHLIERHKEKLASEILQKGVDTLKNAIEANLSKDNPYIMNCVKSLSRLETFLGKLSNE